MAQGHLMVMEAHFIEVPIFLIVFGYVEQVLLHLFQHIQSRSREKPEIQKFGPLQVSIRP